MTGKGMGSCTGNPTPGTMTPPFGGGYGYRHGHGRGRGQGQGFGRRGGRRWSHHGGAWGAATPDAGFVEPEVTREQEMEMLGQQAEYFKSALEQITKRLEELEQPAEEE